MPATLYGGPTSPFARMARVVSLELDRAVEERVIDVYTAEFLDELNPLRQVPTLVTEEGVAIYDSRVICRYFDSTSGKPSLFPSANRWDVDTRWSLAIGVMEAGLQRRMEIVRPEGEKSAGVVAKLETRIDRALERFERDVRIIREGGVRIDSIAVAVALEYTDFRYTTAWRARCPELGAWLESFGARPSMKQTRPRDPH
ncbi:MAG: glutathione S-transferase [Proteobacteria bacterium]|nr:MAG: glutathione S-transferase [Pseudomonadota bacterium]